MYVPNIAQRTLTTFQQVRMALCDAANTGGAACTANCSTCALNNEDSLRAFLLELLEKEDE